MRLFKFLTLTAVALIAVFLHNIKAEDVDDTPKTFSEYIFGKDFTVQCFNEIKFANEDYEVKKVNEFSWTTAIYNKENCPGAYQAFLNQKEDNERRKREKLQELFEKAAGKEYEELMLKLKGQLILMDFVDNCKTEITKKAEGEDQIFEFPAFSGFTDKWNYFIDHEECPDARTFFWTERRAHREALEEFKLKKDEREVSEAEKSRREELDQIYSRFFPD